MGKDFCGKTVIITGAGSGIGKATALAFAAQGAQLVLSDINQKSLEETAKECFETTDVGFCITVVGDVSNPQANQELIDAAITKFGQLDILVNNAGIGITSYINSENLLDMYDKLFSINVKGALNMSHLAAPHLIQTKGCIVNVSSTSAFMTSEGQLLYTMTKAAVTMLTKNLGAELGRHGVRCNEVNPSFTNTNIWEGFGMGDQKADIFELAKKKLPLGKTMSPNDIANAILFLADGKRASHITGASLVVDAGLLCRNLNITE